MYKEIIAILCLLSFFACGNQQEVTEKNFVKGAYEVNLTDIPTDCSSVKIQSPVLPILREKEENIVLYWEFYVKENAKSITLEDLRFSLVGSCNLADFDGFSIDYKNAETEDNFAEMQDDVEADEKGNLAFSGDVELVAGKNVFRLMCKLDDEANIRDFMVVRPLEMTLSGKTYELNAEPMQRKLGIALLKFHQKDVYAYRIPGLVTTNEGTLIAVYDMRYETSKDLQGHIDVGMSRSTDGGQTWEKTKVIMNMGEYGGKPQKLNGVGDPAVLYDKAHNTLWVSGLWVHGMTEKDMAWWGSKPGMSPEQTGQMILTKSTDDGKTWSEPYNITKQIKKPEWQLLLQGPGMGISVGDSLLVFPAQFKHNTGDKAIDGGDYSPFSTIIYSKDKGKTWTIGTGAKSNTTEAQVIALNDGSLMLNMRDDRNRKDKGDTNGRAVAVTSDLGKTWTTHSTSNSALIEPNCMASIIKEEFLVNGEKKTLVLFSNPASKHKRVDMSIRVSYDDAQTWGKNDVTLIDAGQGWGYSCLTKVDDQHVGIIYEGSGANLVFQVFHIDELVK